MKVVAWITDPMVIDRILGHREEAGLVSPFEPRRPGAGRVAATGYFVGGNSLSSANGQQLSTTRRLLTVSLSFHLAGSGAATHPKVERLSLHPTPMR
jgi:hypothetical protein